jgi:uncharacterized protein (TIGR02246 family)
VRDRDRQLERVIEAYKAAVLAKDVEALIALYDPEVRIFDMWATWSYVGAAAWRQAVEQWFASLGDEAVTVRVQDVQIAAGEDFAMVSAVLTYANSSAGKPGRSMQNRLTWSLARRETGWRIVHEHTSAPIGVDLKAILQRETDS